MNARLASGRRLASAIALALSLMLGVTACEDGESPTLDPAGSGAPLFDEGVDPAETQSEIDE